MPDYAEFEIRLFGPDHELVLTVPVVAESENIARMKAAVLCSERGLKEYDVLTQQKTCGCEPSPVQFAERRPEEIKARFSDETP